MAQDSTAGDSIFWFGSEPPPRASWYVGADAIALQRLYSGLGPVATEGPVSTGTASTTSIALSQQDLNDPFQAGVQFTVGHTFDDSPYQVEASYFWVSPFDSSAQAADPFSNLYSPFTTNHGLPENTALDQNSQVAIHLVSRLESGDIDCEVRVALARRRSDDHGLAGSAAPGGSRGVRLLVVAVAESQSRLRACPYEQ